MSETPADNTRFENQVILIAILTGFIGSIVIYFLNLPPIVISIFLATGIASLVYRFLGGTAGATMTMGAFKVTGSIAVLLCSAYFINEELAKQITPIQTSLEKVSFEPHRSNWMALDKNSGEPIKITVKETQEVLPLASKNTFQNVPLRLVKKGNHYIITSEADTAFILGTLETSILHANGFFSELGKTEHFVVSERLEINQEDALTPFPFKIKPKVFANDYSSFQLIDKKTEQVIYENQIYRRSYLIDEINGKTYLIWVVEVSHKEKDPNDENSMAPYAKFAIAELALTM